MTSLNNLQMNRMLREEEHSMVATEDTMALEVNGLHVHLTFMPFPDSDTAEAIRAILKNSYIRTLQA